MLSLSSRKEKLPKDGTAAKFALGILTLMNFINFMDRCCVSAVLPQIQAFFEIKSREAGYIQTSFIVSVIICSPIFGYLGDRISRKLIVLCGILIWSFSTIVASFVDRNYFWIFVGMRGLVGMGEASYVVVTYSILGDLFSKEKRPLALGIFSLAMPFGCGAGYMQGPLFYKIGLHLTSSSNQERAWQWAFRATPLLGLICLLLSIFFLPDPERGNADDVPEANKRTSLLTDFIALSKNGSVVFVTLAYIALDFVGGSLTYWIPTYVDANHANSSIFFGGSTEFGVCTIIGGIGGVFAGVYFSKLLKKRFGIMCADALVCGISLILCAPFLFCALLLLNSTTWLGWLLILLSVITVTAIWPLLPNIFLETVIPTRRALVSGLSNLFGNAFGDAISPVIVGHIKDKLLEYSTPYKALQYGLMINVLVAAVGSLLFFISALFFKRDYRICKERMAQECINAPRTENTKK